MVAFSAATPSLSSDTVSLYFAKDALLDNLPVLIFYGPSTTGNQTQNGSRIQAHIYTLAGFQSFPRLTVSPSSPLYAAVYHLPEDQQGDPICRGLAVSLLSYYSGMSEALKTSLKELTARRRLDRVAPAMFDEMHAGEVASRMVRIEDAQETISSITSALAAQHISWIDLDIVLPPKTISRVMGSEGSEHTPSFGGDGLPLYHYGEQDSLVNLLGSPTFLPTSKLRRAPSKPTAHSKSRSLLKEQKISLRREMCELLDTEERYLGKLHDLVNSIAIEFRQKLQRNGSIVGSPNLSNLDGLFPQSLSAMLEVNTSFHKDIQDVLHRTENEAISDIEASHDFPSDLTIIAGRKRDLTGTAAFARELLRWFPKFTNPYQDFMRASTAFPSLLNDYLQDDNTNFSRLANEIGEQRLRSALIEPVQRLPRYSLFIDNMINLLPSSHPGLTSLLKARDIITDICSLDTSSLAENNQTVSALKKLVTNWPASFSPRGRLITAVDVHQLTPPFKPAGEVRASILLLFPEALVLLRKADENALSARGVIAEVDRPVMSTIAAQSSNTSMDKGLIYRAEMQLASLQLTESEDGHLIWATCTSNLTPGATQQSVFDTPQTSTRVFSLLGAYDRKAARFCEEVAKATIEDRFPEALRESDKWALRTISTSSESLSVLAAVWEDDPASHKVGLHDVSRVRVIVEKGKSAKIVLSENVELDIVAHIIPLKHGGYHLDIECVNGDRSMVDTTSEHLTDILVQRLAGLIRNQGQKLNASRISFHCDVLQNLPLHKHVHESRIRSFRPISPVKMISNFLSVGMGSQTSSATKPRGEQPTLQSSTPVLRPFSMRSKIDDLQASDETLLGNKVTVVEANGAKFCDTFTILEQTFAAYIVALRSRSGNVVGKALRGRAGADELIVNELYNVLVEDPSRVQSAADVTVDILFAAFEKFLKVAWTEHMGPVLTANVIHGMQSKFDSGNPGEFTLHFKQCLEDMTPQNKRAFAAAIKLLSDLLDASGNDGDRGALIASFAEVLVLDGNPHDYITLLDRIVDNYDNLFDASPAFSPSDGKLNGLESNSLKRNRSFNTGSLSSNASSLRKKFGFGMSNKSESESKVASVWRTLSKNAKLGGESQQQSSSFSKASLVRSRSTDLDTRMLPPSRPVSRDLPPLPCVSSPDESHSRPGSSHLNFSTLDTIGEGTPTKHMMLAKKKRRSSLSDLKSGGESRIVPSWSPSHLRQTNIQQRPHEPLKTLPRTPSPSKISFNLQEHPSSSQSSASPQKLAMPQRFGSPQRLGSPERFGSPDRPGSSERLGSPERFSVARRKENPPLTSRRIQPNKAVPMHASDEVVSITTSPKKQANSQSGIPTSKGGLSERAWPPNATPPPKKLPQPSQKLRIQSPQKLRERLSNEQKAIGTAETSLHAELAKIGEELSVFKLQRSPIKSFPSKPATNHIANTKPSHSSIDNLSAHVATLSTTCTTTLASLTASTTAISQDVETSLLAADKKARKLDELYREANAENEALYERFNDELGRILRGVRAGKGVEELRAKMVEAQAEVGRLKIDNARLKREVMGLRSLLRDG